MQDLIREALEDINKKNPGLNQDMATLTSLVLDWIKSKKGWTLNPYLLGRDLGEYLSGFVLTKQLTRGELLSAFAGKITDAKVVICGSCGTIHPVIPAEAEMVNLHWIEWLRQDGWRQRGKPQLWTCPSCLMK